MQTDQGRCNINGACIAHYIRIWRIESWKEKKTIQIKKRQNDMRYAVGIANYFNIDPTLCKTGICADSDGGRIGIWLILWRQLSYQMIRKNIRKRLSGNEKKL